MAGMLGRKAPKNAPALMLSSILSGQIPDHPADVDYLHIPDWQMLGNDRYGDCVAVTWANVRRLVTRQAGQEVYPTVDEVITFYKTQNPNFPTEDLGMDIQTALEDLVHSGGPDGAKALAFAKVDTKNLEEVKAALAIFGFLWTGLTVTQANMQDFDLQRPWDVHPHSPTEGGHSVISGGYDSDQVAGDVTFVTWAEETSFTDGFWNKQVEEAWVVIWPEHLGMNPFLKGIDQQKLAEAYQQITGRPFPNTPPAPDPVPPVDPPLPPVDPADQTLAAVANKYLAAKNHSHALLVELKAALTAWLAAHDLRS